MKFGKWALVLVLVLVGPASAWAQGGGGGPCDAPPPIPPPDTLPEGFGVNVFADGIPWATSLCWDNRGRAFVGESFFFVPAPDQRVWVLQDTDGDGVADVQNIFGESFGQVLGLAALPRAPRGRIISEARKRKTSVANLMRIGALSEFPVDIFVNHTLTGFTVQDEFLGILSRLRDLNGDGDALDPGEREDILTGLPAGGDHNNDNIAIGPDALLYFGLGIRTNWGGVDKPDGNLAVGECIITETCINGAILRVRPDGSHLEVVARGLRNAFGVGFTSNGVLLVTDNGPDIRNCHPVACAPDELNVIHPITAWPANLAPGGGKTPCGALDKAPNYGAPDFAGTPPPGTGTIGPIHNFPPSVSADGFDINLTDTWCGFEGDLFVAEFGNFGNFEAFTQGVRIERLELITNRRGVPTSAVRHAFGGQTLSFGHPVDAKFGPDDALYVTIFSGFGFEPPGRVIRIFPIDSDNDGTPDICE
ncbi:MAG: hypothetical protein O7H41_20685 [Planctomycetota bacterium]|nr:hypothetical protein [Planctomycetota bacterium]